MFETDGKKLLILKGKKVSFTGCVVYDVGIEIKPANNVAIEKYNKKDQWIVFYLIRLKQLSMHHN